jgi:uncharacterized protein (TIGR03492 family)
MQLLVLSNGHGEDAIALRIIEQLQSQPQAPKIVALPLVGMGHAYTHGNIPIIGPMQQMPSGGFIYMDGRQLWQDIQGGLLKLTLAQYQVIRQWGKTGGKILAVGDIVPLLFAWSSGAEYAFVGTAKSEYYLRDEDGWLPQTSRLERWLGGVYAPWDRWLMSRPRCKAVFPRDSLTTEVLKKWSIPAFDLGNPMMDGIKGKRKKEKGKNYNSKLALENRKGFKVQNNVLTILLLPGSRMPEAQRNWQTILEAVKEVVATFYRESFSTKYAISTQSVRFLAAIAPALPLAPFETALVDGGWLSQPLDSVELPIEDPDALVFEQNSTTLILSKNAFADCLQGADLAIAMTGTAVEQFVGLGKPAIAISGKGPQFTYAFAEAQTRLLGCSVILVKQPQQVTNAIQTLLKDPDRWHLVNENGRRRMGEAGAAARIANCLMEVMTH